MPITRDKTKQEWKVRTGKWGGTGSCRPLGGNDRDLCFLLSEFEEFKGEI